MKKRMGNFEKIGYFWMLPKGDTFVDLMSNIGQWRNTLDKIDVIGYADHVLYRNFSSAQRSAGFAKMREEGLPLGLEVGAIKHWIANYVNQHMGGDFSRTGEAMFLSQNGDFWSRFVAEGADIKAFAFDEPLVDVINNKNLYGLTTDEECFDFAIEQTAWFVYHIRENYPDAVLGDIGVAPSHNIGNLNNTDTLIAWIDALESKLYELTGRGQDFYRLDVNWAVFDRPSNTHEAGWAEVKRFEDYCKSIGLPLSLIYWGSEHSTGYSWADRNTDKLWYDQIMRMGAHYLAAGGSPDQFGVQTWVNVTFNGVNTALPFSTLPENLRWSFTNSALDFYNTFVEPVEIPLAYPISGTADFSDWLNIRFDAVPTGWTGSTRFIMSITDDKNSARRYNVTEFVHFNKKPGGNTVLRPLDLFLDETGGIIDFSKITSVSFATTGGGSTAVSNFALVTPRSLSYDDNIAPVLASEVVELDKIGGGKAVSPSDRDFYAKTFNPATGDFAVYKYLEFDIYIADFASVGTNNLRFTLQSASGSTNYNFTNRISSQYSLTGSGWNHVRIPLDSPVSGGTANLNEITDLLFTAADNGNNANNIIGTFAVKNIYLTDKDA